MFHVLIIGSGTMGKIHARAYQEMQDVQVAGIVDINNGRAESLAKQLNCRAFTTFEDAMEQTDHVDIVDICLPTFLHRTYVEKAADAGIHIICEKPLARNLEDARSMINYCQSKGVKLFVGHVLRFFPEYKKIKKLIEDGTIGDVGVVRTSRGGIFPAGVNDWYADFKSSGGLVLDMIIHDFDFLRWCFGEVERVFAKSLHGRKVERLDYALVTLRFKNGIIAHVEGTWAHEGFSSAIEVAGKSGIIAFDSAKEKPLLLRLRGQQAGNRGVEVPESPLRQTPYDLELAHFLSCLQTNSEPIVSAEDAFKAMEIALAAIESIETGKPVTIG
ncbi:Gfo/Idh/MocA family protein [Paenactinomyces guangxiensis]|uniref:Gfo/Idh/MocA family oxidoreductase n=1 Tax=Paenactinomyces guangxiensis TaxID=1490290 RepID=A0A7W1WQT9_9BACL|nr:Gfo/Idh/MocA family oxidoreductase [Paenactinomyces guangxiensis]MBA4494355.1 Gfo/Idh/MocA family oxidoreductase [Paenactinomyces guangxiensis]MBH8591590.1 Gfo/Idh/MocA family oxidoreductase [Paenactinomyces guangxiensis]